MKLQFGFNTDFSKNVLLNNMLWGTHELLISCCVTESCDTKNTQEKHITKLEQLKLPGCVTSYNTQLNQETRGASSPEFAWGLPFYKPARYPQMLGQHLAKNLDKSEIQGTFCNLQGRFDGHRNFHLLAELDSISKIPMQIGYIL